MDFNNYNKLFKSSGAEIDRKIIYLSVFLFIGFLLSVSIVWFPFYFLFFLASVLFLAIIFWKTEESLIGLIFYLPFQIALNASESVDLASSRIFIIILFLVWLVKALAQKKLNIPDKPAAWLLAIFLGLAALSVYFSIDQERSVIRLLFYLSIFPLYFVAAAYLNSTAKIIKTVYLLLFSAVLTSLIGLIQFLSQFVFGIDAIMNFWSKNIAYLFYGQSFGKAVVANPSWLVNIGGETFFRAISFFPDPHMFAFYLGLVAPIALSMALFSGVLNFSFWQKFLLYACNAILFLALGLTFSRAGYVGAFFGIIAIVFWGWNFFGKRIKFTVIMFFLIGAMALFNSSNQIVARFFTSFNPAEGSNSERLLNWRQAVKTIENYPIAGAGVGVYAEAINARALSRSAITAHNTYLDIAAEMGLPALLVWIILLISTIKNLSLILKSKNRELSKEKAIALGLIGVFVWFSAQMVFDTAIYSPTLLAMLMVYLAIAGNLEKASAIK